MAEFLAVIEIQEIRVLGDQKSEKSPVVQNVKAKTGLRLPVSDKTYPLHITAITEKSVQFHVEDFLVKSVPGNEIKPVDFEIPLGGQDMLSVKDGETAVIFLLKVQKIAPASPSVQPVKINMPTHYFKSTQELLGELEKKLATKILVYYMPRNVIINQNDPDYFMEMFREDKHFPKISLVIHSPGGDSMASLRIVSLLRHFCDELEVIVPSTATSAATLLSLGADKILFSPLGYLGPIDTQLTDISDERLTKMSYYQISSDSFRRAKEMLESEKKDTEGPYAELFKHIHPLVVAEVDRLSTRSKQTATVMMKMHGNPFPDEKIEFLANHLVYDYPSHGFPILYGEAKKIGLNAEMLPDDVSKILWDLFKYYRSVTTEKLTAVSTEWHHIELNQALIESVGKRIVRRYSFDKKFSLAERRWQTSNDNSNWKKYLHAETPEGQPKIANVEADDEPVAGVPAIPVAPPTSPQLPMPETSSTGAIPVASPPIV